MNTKEIPVFCAWCKKHSTQWNPPAITPKGEYNYASHGICPECFTREQLIWKKNNGIKTESQMTFKDYIMEQYMKLSDGVK